MDDIILVAPFDGFNQLKHIVSKPKKKTKAIKETHTLGAQEGRGGGCGTSFLGKRFMPCITLTLSRTDKEFFRHLQVIHSLNFKCLLWYHKNTKLNLCQFSWKNWLYSGYLRTVYFLIQACMLGNTQFRDLEMRTVLIYLSLLSLLSLLSSSLLICWQDFNLPDFLWRNAIGHLFQHFQHILGTNKNSQQNFKQFKSSNDLFN